MSASRATESRGSTELEVRLSLNGRTGEEEEEEAEGSTAAGVLEINGRMKNVSGPGLGL